MPPDTHGKCQSMGRGRGIYGCLGTASPWEAAAGSPHQDKRQRREVTELLRRVTTGSPAPHPVAPHHGRVSPTTPPQEERGSGTAAVTHLPPARAGRRDGNHPGTPMSKHLLTPRAEPRPPCREKAAEEQSHAPCREETDAAGPAQAFPVAVRGC